MKTKILIIGCILAVLTVLNSCTKEDAESCEANPVQCLGTCLTAPELCANGVVLDENNAAIDSTSAVSKLPVRN